MSSVSVLRTALVCRTPLSRTGWLLNSLSVRNGSNVLIGASTAAPSCPPLLSPDVPSEPLNCRINKTNKDCMFVAWEKPKSDGGSPITGYYIERKERNSLLWVKANDTVVRTTEYPCAGLIEGLEYTFRVSAINRAGQGKPSAKTDFVTARTPIGMFSTITRLFCCFLSVPFLSFQYLLSSPRHSREARDTGCYQKLCHTGLDSSQERRRQQNHRLLC